MPCSRRRFSALAPSAYASSGYREIAYDLRMRSSATAGCRLAFGFQSAAYHPRCVLFDVHAIYRYPRQQHLSDSEAFSVRYRWRFFVFFSFICRQVLDSCYQVSINNFLLSWDGIGKGVFLTFSLPCVMLVASRCGMVGSEKIRISWRDSSEWFSVWMWWL